MDAAKKYVDLKISLRTLQNSNLEIKSQQDLDAQTEASMQSYIEAAVDAGIKAANSQIGDKGIESEIGNLITIRSKVVTNAIINGARIGVTVESLLTLPDTLKNAGVDYEAVEGLLKQNAQIGSIVAESFKALGQPVPLSLADETKKSAKPAEPSD